MGELCELMNQRRKHFSYKISNFTKTDYKVTEIDKSDYYKSFFWKAKKEVKKPPEMTSDQLSTWTITKEIPKYK